MTDYPRISGRLGQTVNLDMYFFQGGIAAYPHALRRVDIYESSVQEANLVAQINFPYPDDINYPLPARTIANPSGSGDIIGAYTVDFDIPADFDEGLYFDVWRYVGADLGTTDSDYDDETIWLYNCGKFWAYQNQWFADDGLMTPRVSFDALDTFFRKEELRTLEVGMMPMPLYDYDHNFIAPLLAAATATISIETYNCELIVDAAPMKIGIRQGSYRTNPWVLQYVMQPNTFFVGSYKYRVTLTFPNGQTRISENIAFEIS